MSLKGFEYWCTVHQGRSMNEWFTSGFHGPEVRGHGNHCRHWRSMNQTFSCRCVAATLVLLAMTNVLLTGGFGEARISANALVSRKMVSTLAGPVKALGTTSTEGSAGTGVSFDLTLSQT